MADIGTAVLRVVPDMEGLGATLGGYFSSSKWSSLGKAAGVALGAGIVAGGAAKGLYEIGEAFDDVSDKIRTQTGATGKRLAALNKSFKDVVSDVPADFADAGDAVASLNQRLGLTGKPLERMSKQMLELSRITDTDVRENIESVSKAFRDWDVRTKDQSKTLDAFYRLSQKSGVGVADLATEVQRFGSPLRQLGFTLDEAAAMFANFERSGVNTQTMVPGLKLAISNLTRPTEDLAASMEKLGIDVGKPDVALQQVFELMSSKGIPTVEKTGLAMDVFGKRAGADMAEAVRQGRFEVDDLLKVMEDGQDTIRQAGRDTMDFGEQLTLLKNNVFVALEPVAKRVFGAIGDEARRVRKILTDESLTSDEKFSAVLDELGRVAEKYGPKLAEAGGKIGVALLKGIVNAFIHSDLLGRLFIGAAVLRLVGGSAAVKGAGTLIGKTMGKGIPGGLVIGVATATVLLAPEAYKLGHKLGEMIKKPLRDVFNWIVDTFGGVADKVLGVFSGMIGGLADIYDRLASLPIIGEAFKPLASGLHDVEDSINGVRDAMREIRKFRDDPLGFTKTALRENDLSIAATIDKLTSMGISYKRASKIAERAYGDVNASARGALKINKQVLDGMDARLGIHTKNTDRDLDRVRDDLDRTSDRSRTYADRTDDAFDKTTGSSAKMARGVGHNVSSLANGVATGLEAIKDNLNKSLAAFQVKKVGYSVKKVGNVVGNVVGAQKGAIVGGSGSGDKVPLHIGGQLAAMVEPGELVSVTNRTATAAQMALNRRIPRRARGGVVPGATGGLHPSILNLVSSLYSRFGGSVTSGLRAGDSGSLHSTGQAADYVPSNWPAAAAAVNRVGSSLLEGIYNPSAFGGPAVSWDSGSRVPSSFWGSSTWAAHANHIHLAIADGTKAVAGAAVEQIKRVLLKGPKGPLRDMGQAVLDKARGAANAYLKKVMPRVGVEAVGPGANVKNLPSALQKYNHIYAEHNSAGGDWGGFRMPFNAVAALAEWAGAPGISMARTAIGESNLRPGATGIDPGGTKGLGLWMITTGFNDALIAKLGGQSAMRNPVLNAQAMNSIYDAQGINAWYSSTKDGSNTHYEGPLLRKFGGIVPHLAKGGKAGKGEVKRGPTDPAFKRFMKARRIADKLKGFVGEQGKIARMDERISIAETLASQDSSELGSDLGPNERQKQIRLNERLLAQMVMARKLARTGLRRLDFPKGMSTAGVKPGQLRNVKGGFNQTLLDLTGLTGRSGRIFDTQMQLDTLRHAGATPMDISGLRSVIEAARYGAFDGVDGRGGSIGRGKWGIAGERGPEVIRGPATVHSPAESAAMLAPQVTVENNFDWEGMDLFITTKVDGQVAKREKVSRRRARQMIR